jgi:hypothetical protein
VIVIGGTVLILIFGFEIWISVTALVIIVVIIIILLLLVLVYVLYKLKPPKKPKKPKKRKKVRVIIGGNMELWFFNGPAPATYPVRAPLTARAVPPTTGTFNWSMAAGGAIADFGGAPTAVGPAVVLTSKDASKTVNDVKVQCDFTGTAGETGTTSRTTTVKAPTSMTRLGATTTSAAFPPANWTTLISYSIQDQFGTTLPRNVPINEQWDDKPPKPAFPGTNWPSFPPTEGATTVSPARWSDRVAIRDGVPPVLIPTPNAAGTGGPLIQFFAGHWQVGSLTIGVGRRALSVTWQFHQDHGDHV